MYILVPSQFKNCQQNNTKAVTSNMKSGLLLKNTHYSTAQTNRSGEGWERHDMYILGYVQLSKQGSAFFEYCLCPVTLGFQVGRPEHGETTVNLTPITTIRLTQACQFLLDNRTWQVLYVSQTVSE